MATGYQAHQADLQAIRQYSYEKNALAFIIIKGASYSSDII
jgi:hypothetical protein